MALWRRSSWAIGHSATMAGGPIGTRPWRPTTSVTIEVGRTSTSSSHGSRSSVNAPIRCDHRVDESARQPSTDTGDQPHGGAGGASARGDRRRTDRHDRPLRIRGHRLDQHHVGVTAGDPGGARIDRLVVDVVALEPAHERCRGVADVHRQHADVSPADQPLADHVRRADRHDRGVVGERGAEFGTGSVVADLVGQLPHRLERLGRRRDVGAQPPQRPDERMPLDDASARHHEAGRIDPERPERVRRLLGERRRIGALGPSHVAKVLDRMHESTVVRNPVAWRSDRSVGAASWPHAT